MQRWLTLLSLLLLLRPVRAEEEINAETEASGGVAFLLRERHHAKRLAEGPRKGYTEYTDSIRFGYYGLKVTQRIDPETDWLPKKGRWGDRFVGIKGKRVARYMQSNWSGWWFLRSIRYRLDGDEKDRPSPAWNGRLVYLGLRERAPYRAVGEAIWRDKAGGHLRARFVGWRPADYFGLRLSYHPPEGRTLVSIRYVLTAHPYDYADRGEWQRRRWVATSRRDAPLSEATPVVLETGAENRLALFNRFGHNTAGCLFAGDAESVRRIAVRTRGQAVQVELDPVKPQAPIACLLGDWTRAPYAWPATKWFDRPEAEFAATLRDTRDSRPALPPRPRRHLYDADVALLARDEDLDAAHGDGLRQAWLSARSLWERLTRETDLDGDARAATLSAFDKALTTYMRRRQALRKDALRRQIW